MNRNVFRFAAALLLASSAPISSQGQAISIVDGRRPGDISQAKVTLQVAGKMKAPTEKMEDVPMAVNCQLAFQNVIREITASEISAARHYGAASVELRVGDQTERTSLPQSLNTMLVDLKSEETVDFVSPGGALSRKELDAITLPGDLLAVYRLLPKQQVKAGDKWTHENEDLAALLNLERVGVNEVKSELVKVENGLAQMKLTGTVKGRSSGVATEMRIAGDYRFDLRWKRINWLQLRINERRDPSPVAPGFTVDAELRMLVSPLKRADLAPSLQSQIAEVSERDRLVRYESKSAGYSMLHGRRWYLVDDRDRHAAWRIVEDGDVIAQCNAVRLRDMEAGKSLSIEEFQQDIQKALGKQFGQFEAANRKERKDGGQILRVAVRGLASAVPVRWIYYHISTVEGRSANLVFVMDAEKSERLGKDDVVAATTIAIPIAAENLPTPQKEKSVAQTADRRASQRR